MISWLRTKHTGCERDDQVRVMPSSLRKADHEGDVGVSLRAFLIPLSEHQMRFQITQFGLIGFDLIRFDSIEFDSI